jgi:hypothetical protein
MKVKILKIEPFKDWEQIVIGRIKGINIEFFDPNGKFEEEDLKKEFDVKICGLRGKVEGAGGPEKFEPDEIVANVIEKNLDYVILDCGLFQFDYMINSKNEGKFEIGKFVRIKNPRLDITV